MYFLSKTMSNLFSNPKAKFILNPKVKFKTHSKHIFSKLNEKLFKHKAKNKFKKNYFFLVLPIYVINFLKIIGCYYKFKALFF